MCIVSFFRANTEPFYKLHSKILCLYLSRSPAKHKNPLITLFNKTLFRLYLCYKTHKLAKNFDIILANDGWFVPFLRDDSNFLVRLWHLNAPKKANKKLRLFDKLVILSHYELLRWGKYHKNISVIPNFLPEIPRISTNHAQKVILSVGRLSQEKGFSRLLDVWKILQDSINSQDFIKSIKSQEYINSHDFTKLSQDLSEWRLVIVGDGVLKPQIEQKIKMLNLQNSVILKPFTKNIEREYLNASIYAMASHFEGFGMALAEASSYALPCIAFDVATGPSDIISHDKSGFLIANNDLQDYADKLTALMCDVSLRKRFGSEARKIAKEKFSKENIMKLWESLFEKRF